MRILGEGKEEREAGSCLSVLVQVDSSLRNNTSAMKHMATHATDRTDSH